MLVCIYLNAFFIVIPNIVIELNNFYIFFKNCITFRLSSKISSSAIEFIIPTTTKCLLSQKYIINSKAYFTNYCTYMNAFLIVIPNIELEFFHIFKNCITFRLSSAAEVCRLRMLADNTAWNGKCKIGSSAAFELLGRHL